MSIRCSHIDVVFDGNSYLKDVSFTVAPQEVVLLYGPSGSGKTTLFNILCAMSEATSSRAGVFWGDYQVCSLEKANKVRFRYISMVYSLFYFLESLNVEQNIRLPAVFAGVAEDEIDRRLEELYRVFAFDGKLSNLDLSTLRARSIAGLSNGQKELVGIARAFVLDSPYVFADEILRSFNKEGEELLWEKILSSPELGIGSRRGFFMITHKEHLRHDPRISKVYTIDNSALVRM
jgi:putative ABC transport system ATP-binding protein